jgi:acyl-CoA thioesterase
VSAAMEGRDERQTFLARDAFARDLGIELVSAGPGTAKVRLALGLRHLNGVGVAHGGVIFTLADAAFSVASNSRGGVAVAIDAHINYFKGVSGGVLYAEAREEFLHHKLAAYAVVVTDDKGEKIAAFQGLAYRKSEQC